MADRLSLGLGPEVRKLKLGESFSKNGNTAFHTFRYDFKPASMDTKKMATVEIGASNQTTVAVPNVDSAAGTSHTVFKGPRKPYTKECVLIIDHVTGEIVLEKLSSNVQLKKTRTEGSSKMQPGPGMSGDPSPTLPTPTTTFKKASPPQQQQHQHQQKYSPNQRPPSHSPQQRTPPNHHATSPTEVGSSHGGGSAGRSPPVNQRSPSMPSLVPPSHAKASSAAGSSSSSSYAASKEIGSMPVFTDNDFSVAAPEQAPEHPADAASEVGILSDSSNDSSSGSSSSSSDSSDSEGEDKDLRRAPASVEHPMSNSQYSSSSSSSAYPNMPCFSQLSQLSEDLQLSESESEAD